MSKMLKDRPLKDFPIPEGIEFMKINPQTGQMSLAKEAILECFKEGTRPAPGFFSESKMTTDFFKFDFNLPGKDN
jgi:penicillin-binding protein 1A